MYEWQKQIQIIVDEIDSCIRNYNDEVLTLRFLSRKLGYSEYYTTILHLIMVFHPMKPLPGRSRQHME